MAGYDIRTGEIRIYWSSTKGERTRCGSRCRDGSPCEAPVVWDRRRDRPVNGRCRMHGGLSTGPQTVEGRRRIADSNRKRANSERTKRGKHKEVTQQRDTP